MTNTDPRRFIGATIRANNRTFGLRPAQEAGPEETVVAIVDDYHLIVETDAGNVYTNGDFTVMRFAAGLTK